MSRRFTFSRWLIRQGRRNDAVGELARFAAARSGAPLGAFRPAAWQRFVQEQGAPQDIVDSVNQAFKEFAGRNNP